MVLTDPAGAHSAEIKRLHVDPRPLIFLIWGGVVVRCLCNCCLFSRVYSHYTASTLEACAQSRPYQFKWIHGEPACFDLFFSIHRIRCFGRCCISVEQISKPLYDGFDPNSFVCIRLMSVHGRLEYIFLFLAFWLLPFLLELECAMQRAHKNVGNIISLCRKKN